MSDYPKALYRGEHYSDWDRFCLDLQNKVIDVVNVRSQAQENEARAQGFTDAAELMQPAVEIQDAKQGKKWPQMNAAERRAYKESKAQNVHT